VLKVEHELNTLMLTAKQSFIDSQLPLVTSRHQLHINLITHVYVKKIVKHW